MSNWPLECCKKMTRAVKEGYVQPLDGGVAFNPGYPKEGSFGDPLKPAPKIVYCPWCNTPIAAPLSEIVWHRLDAIVSCGMVVEVTAAATDEGVPIIAVWTREDRDANAPATDGDWTIRAIDGESCRWDHVGIDGRIGDVVPLEPPAYLLHIEG